MTPNKAFILAAGLGKRLRPITLERPKPMVEVGERTLIDRALDHLQQAGIDDVVVNAHYLSDILESHLAGRSAPEIHISHEDELLETGGGIKKMLQHFAADFYVLSGDALWTDGPGESALQRLSDMWNPQQMDILMLLQPVSNMTLTKGVGDYRIDADGRAIRAKDQSGDLMFTSIRINAPHIFEGSPDGPFSYLELMDRAEEQGRLYGLVHDGDWHHISTPEDLEAVCGTYRDRKTGT